MPGRLRLAVVAAALLAAAGCTSSPAACTEIGSPSGIAVTVSDDLAPDVTALSLEVCVGGSCRTLPVELSAGTDSRSDDCPITADDSTCAATMVPNGTLVGFADVPDLPVGNVEVGATAAVGGKKHHFEPITLDVSTTYPNGDRCPAGGNQAKVEVRRSGLIG